MNDIELFKKYIIEHERQLFHFILVSVKDYHDACDITQSTMELALRKINTLKKVESARAWLFQIGRNEISSYFRVRSRRESLEYTGDPERVIYEIEDLANSALDQMIFEADKSNIRKAFDRLDSSLRQLLELRYIQKFTYKEISEILSISEIASRSRMFRAKKKLYAYYEQIEKGGLSCETARKK